jgi:hypothetical protein
MSKTEIIVDILSNLDMPSKTIEKHLIENIDRFIHLLWGKSDKYEGPLYDGLQKNEWSIVTVLVGNWAMESYVDFLKDEQVLREDIELFMTKQYLANFSISLLKGVLTAGLVPGTDETEIIILEKIQQIPSIYKFIEEDLDKLKMQVDVLFKSSCCGTWNYKKIKQQILILSNDKGALATIINKIKLYKDHELMVKK